MPNDRPPDGSASVNMTTISCTPSTSQTLRIRSITVKTDDVFPRKCQLWNVWSRQRWRKEIAIVRKKYKRKDKKVNPVNTQLENSVKPGGSPVGLCVEREICGAGKTVPRGSRLTPERLANMRIGTGFLTDDEKNLFIDILFEFEGVLAFDDSEMGLLNPEVEPPVEIHTVPHTPWQQQSLRLPKAMQEAAAAILKKKLANGILEHSQGAYRSRFFLVAKKTPGEYRLINDVQPLNAVTIRDACMPPSVDDFSEDFAGYPILTSVDLFSGYDQILLDERFRDLTSFMTDLGLLRHTRIPQGWANSVAVFMRIILKVLWELVPEYARPFIDDIALKGPKSRYNDEEVSPGVRRFVAEHADLFRMLLRALWLSGLTVSGYKLAIGMPGIDVVGVICDYDGRRPEQKKVQKILDWPIPSSVTEARAFIGLCVYYRIFVEGFSIIAAPIMELFRKYARFSWNAERQLAMNALKRHLSEAPVLVSLDFSSSALPIVVSVDASTTVGWGAILSQVQVDETTRPSRFESGVWSDAERKYDAVKLECRGLMKALKKFRFWIYGRHFQLRTDAQTLVWLLNQTPNDLPNAMITRWLTYIRLFDFEVQHVPGNKNSSADALSRRGQAPEDPTEDENDADNYFEAKLGAISAAPVGRSLLINIWLKEAEYDGDDLVLGRYLESLERPVDIDDAEFAKLRKKSKNFLIRDGLLFRKGRGRRSIPRRVIGLPDQRRQTIKQLHDECGHRGRNTTHELVKRRYQWKGMWEDVADYCKSCEVCQKRSQLRYEEPLHPTFSTYVWQKVGVDVVFMPVTKDGYGFIVFARDDLSGWVEARPLKSNNSHEVSRFLYEDVICRHGLPERFVMDWGTENLNVTEALLQRYKVHRVRSSPYHPQSNGLVERGHDPIVNALSKYCQNNVDEWPKYLPLVLWADRVSIRRSTGYAAFELMYGRDCLLPVEFTLESWCVVNWEDEVQSREDLLTARMRQLDERTLTVEQAAENLRDSRLANKTYFDQHKQLRPESQRLSAGDLVLVHDTRHLNNRARARKLEFSWFGPYRIREVGQDSTHFYLKELDGVPLAKSFAGNRLKRFFSRDELDRARQTIHDAIRVRSDFENMPPEEDNEEEDGGDEF